MHSNVHITIHKPFPHPSCLVEHLEVTNYKPCPSQTHFTIKHTFQQNYGSPKKLLSHKSLERLPLATSQTNIMTHRGDVRRNALQTKNKINITAVKGITSKQKERLENEIKDLHSTVLRIKNEHHHERESLQEQIRNHQHEIDRLRIIHLQARSKRNQQPIISLNEPLESISSKYNMETQKLTLLRKQLSLLKTKGFQLQEQNIILNQQIDELRRTRQIERSIHMIASQQQSQNDPYVMKISLKPHNMNCINVCQIYLEIADIIDRLKHSELPSQLLHIKQDLSIRIQTVTEVLQRIQEMLGDGDSLQRGQIKRKMKSMRRKSQEKSINDSQKYLRTCADEEYGADNSLYHMLLAQADVIQRTL